MYTVLPVVSIAQLWGRLCIGSTWVHYKVSFVYSDIVFFLRGVAMLDICFLKVVRGDFVPCF